MNETTLLPQKHGDRPFLRKERAHEALKRAGRYGLGFGGLGLTYALLQALLTAFTFAL